MKKIRTPDELWPWLDRLGDDNRPILFGTIHPGQRFSRGQRRQRRQILFAEAHAYGAPPLDVFTRWRRLHDAHTSSRSRERATSQPHRNLMQVSVSFAALLHAEFLKPTPQEKYIS